MSAVSRVIFDAKGNGPVHAAQAAPHDQLSVCGMRVRFRHLDREGTAEEVTCVKCLRLLAKGETRAYGAG